MVLVLIATTVGLTLGLTYLATASRTTRITRAADDHAQAKHIASSGIELTLAYLEQQPAWSSTRSPGVWVDEEALLGGTLTVEVDFDSADAVTPVAMDDPGFEEQTGQFNNPLLGLPMSLTLGPWDLSRTALLSPLTGLIVPHAGVSWSSLATEGDNVAWASFPVAILGTVSFSQILTDVPAPETRYALSVDAGQFGVLGVLAEFEIRVWSGPTLLASSADASLLSVLDLDPGTKRYTLRFETDATPPSASFRIELVAQSLVGLLSSVFFDNVELVKETDLPVSLVATGKFGQTAHRVRALAVVGQPGTRVRLMHWQDE